MKRRLLKASAFGVVIAAAMAFGLASCQNGLDSVLPADAAHSGAASGSAKGNGQVTSADGPRGGLSAEERKRKIAEFLAKPEVKQTSKGLEELAKLVAVAVEDEGLRNQIYARCMEKFDGETNVLWKHLDGDSKLRASGGGFSERIEALAAKNRGVATSVVGSLGGVQAAIGQFEKAIDAPVHLYWAFPENWDKKTTPLVAFVPLDANPETRASIPGFDSKGNKVEFDKDGKLAKNRPVIVITFNERTLLNGQKKRGLITSEDMAKIQKEVPSKSSSPTLQVASESRLLTITRARFWMEWDEIFWDGKTEFFYVLYRNGLDVSGNLLPYPQYNYESQYQGGSIQWASGWVDINKSHRFTQPYTARDVFGTFLYTGLNSGIRVQWWEEDGFGAHDQLDFHNLDNSLNCSGQWVDADYTWQ
jgi:hypothetical protein